MQLLLQNGMASVKFITCQARCIYKNLKVKVLICSTDILLNRQCLIKIIIPNYANINVSITSPASHKKPQCKPLHTLYYYIDMVVY